VESLSSNRGVQIGEARGVLVWTQHIEDGRVVLDYLGAGVRYGTPLYVAACLPAMSPWQ
jgi:hypothetical protein